MEAWFSENRSYLFFLDQGDYRWHVTRWAKKRGNSGALSWLRASSTIKTPERDDEMTARRHEIGTAKAFGRIRHDIDSMNENRGWRRRPVLWVGLSICALMLAESLWWQALEAGRSRSLPSVRYQRKTSPGSAAFAEQNGVCVHACGGASDLSSKRPQHRRQNTQFQTKRAKNSRSGGVSRFGHFSLAADPAPLFPFRDPRISEMAFRGKQSAPCKRVARELTIFRH